MLFAGPFWYASVPGASGTGPFNPHFVQDIGVAFIVAALPGQPDDVGSPEVKQTIAVTTADVRMSAVIPFRKLR
jgi:hypothetical protein